MPLTRILLIAVGLALLVAPRQETIAEGPTARVAGPQSS